MEIASQKVKTDEILTACVLICNLLLHYNLALRLHEKTCSFLVNQECLISLGMLLS